MNSLQRVGRGLESGMLAGGGVAVLLFTTDIIGFAPLRTVIELAGPLSGETSVAPSEAWVGLAATAASVVLYTLLHFATFAVLGVVASWVVPSASFWATLGRGTAFGVLVCSAVFVAGRALTGSAFFAEAVGPVALVLTNAMAGVIMAGVFAVHAADGEDATAAR